MVHFAKNFAFQSRKSENRAPFCPNLGPGPGLSDFRHQNATFRGSDGSNLKNSGVFGLFWGGFGGSRHFEMTSEPNFTKKFSCFQYLEGKVDPI